MRQWFAEQFHCAAPSFCTERSPQNSLPGLAGHKIQETIPRLIQTKFFPAIGLQRQNMMTESATRTINLHMEFRRGSPNFCHMQHNSRPFCPRAHTTQLHPCDQLTC